MSVRSRIKKPLILAIVVSSLLGISGTLSAANQIVWMNASLAQKTIPNTNNANLKIVLNDRYLLGQAAESLNTLQQQSFILNSLTITAEDGLTDNITSKFLDSASGVLDQNSLFDVGAGVGISTDPNTTESLAKLPVGIIRIEPTAYQSAFSAIPNTSVPRIDIFFGALDQVDAFNKAAFITRADFSRQMVNFYGDVPTLTRLTSNLVKPTTKTNFKEMSVNFTKGNLTAEAAGYLGASTGYSKNMKIHFATAVTSINNPIWTESFVNSMQSIAKKMPITSQLAIYDSRARVDLSHIANAFAALRAEQPFVFATNERLSKLDFTDNRFRYGVVQATMNDESTLFKAVQDGKLGGVVIDTEQDNHALYVAATKAPAYIYGRNGTHILIGAANNPETLLLYANSLRPDTKVKKISLNEQDDPAAELVKIAVGDQLKIARPFTQGDFVKLNESHIPYLAISDSQNGTTIVRSTSLGLY